MGERLIDSLNLYGELLVPEQVSPNADKFIDPYMGKAASEGLWAQRGTMRFNGVSLWRDAAIGAGVG